MKYLNKIISVSLAVLLLAVASPFGVYAETENTLKEEVVYINLNSDGSVNNVNVVNSFDLEKDGTITDYGKYKNLRNMTTTDSINYKNDTVSINAKAGKLYYEGNLESKVIPWNIDIHYFLNGKEKKAKELVGKKGLLSISIDITKNEECGGDFFKDQSLQAVITLDTSICSNIVAEGATVVNVGNNKQLTYTILPGEGAKINLSAEIKDFRMEPIAINGVKMNLNLGITDQLINGISELTSGVLAINAGSQTLSNGLNDITAKSGELTDGANTAYKGICEAAAMQINAELKKNGMSEITLTPSNYSEVLNQLIQKIDKNSAYQKAYDTGVAKVKSEVSANAQSIYAGYIDTISEKVYREYLATQPDLVYYTACSQLISQNLRALGMSASQAEAYVNSPAGVNAINIMVASMGDSQKADAMEAALNALTDEQKEQIKKGAVDKLTAEQKKEIENAYIDKIIKSQDFANQIAGSLSSASASVSNIIRLKGMLDDYGVFVSGLKEYTDSVNKAKSGAKDLANGIAELQKNVDQLSSGENGGLSNMEIVQAVTGDSSPVSFVSENNKNISSLQFVMKTEKIAAEKNAAAASKKKKLNFWQKFLRLFGLY